MPSELRVKFFLEENGEDDCQVTLERIMEFLKKEMIARRRSWEVEQAQGKPAPTRGNTSSEKEQSKYGRPKQDGNKQRGRYKKKESSMVQAEQSEALERDAKQAADNLN